MERIGVYLVVLTLMRLAHAADETAPEEGEQQVEVRAVRPSAPALSVRVTARDAASTPGAHGDAASVLQSLPGVARVGTSGEPVLWGSPARETGIFLDDVPLPFLFHGSGVRSIVPTAWLSWMEVAPAAYGVELGRQLGGVVRLASSDPDMERPTLALGVDTLGTQATASAPLNRGIAVRVGGGVGYVAAWLPWLIPKQNRGLYSIPRFWNAQAQAVMDRPQQRLKIQFLAAGDHSEHEVFLGGTDVSDSSDEQRLTACLSATYKALTPGEDTTVTGYVGFDRDHEHGMSRGQELESGVDSTMFGLRMSHARHLGSHFTARAGLDTQLELFETEHAGSLTVPPREGDEPAFGLSPGRDYVEDTARGLMLGVAPFARGELKLHPLSADAGLRLDMFLIETQRAYPPVGDVPSPGSSTAYAGLGPYARLGWAMSPRAQLMLAASQHHQPPDPRDLGARTGTPTLTPARAQHLVLQESVRLTANWSVDSALFYKHFDQLAARNIDTTPPRAQVLTNDGSGQSYGAQLTLRVRRFFGFDGWLTATVSRSERRDDPSLAMRLFDQDQPLLLTAVLNKTFEGWTVGGRLRYASGAPRAAVVAADYDTVEGRYDPVFSRARSWRLPAFLALDFRVERRFALSDTAQLSSYLEVLNLTNHKAADDVAYSWDYRQRRYVTGPPTLVLLGVSLLL